MANHDPITAGLIRHHAALLPPIPKGWRCALCRGPEERYQATPCERCGALMHYRCYSPAVLSDAERVAAQAAIDEANAPGLDWEVVEIGNGQRHFQWTVRGYRPCDDVLARLIVLCPGCRS